MKIILRSILSLSLAAVLSLQPLSAAAPLSVMAEDTVKEQGKYIYNGDKSFTWKIFENGDGLRLEIEGKGQGVEGNATAEFIWDHLHSDEENGAPPYKLIDNSNGSERYSQTLLSDISEVRVKNIIRFDDSTFFPEDGEESKLKSIRFDDKLFNYKHYGFFPELESVIVDSGNRAIKSEDDGRTLRRSPEHNGDFSELILKIITKDEKECEIPEGVKRIKEKAFVGMGLLSSIKLPESLEFIEEDAFSDCSGIKKINIPKNVKYLVDGSLVSPDDVDPAGLVSMVSAFNHMINLSEITVDQDNQYFTSEDGILYSKDKKTLCYYPAERQCDGNSFKIPAEVETIAYNAFEAYNEHLCSVFIPKSVKRIEYKDDNGSYFSNAFFQMLDVFYEGSEEEWDRLFDGHFQSNSVFPVVHFNRTDPVIDKELWKGNDGSCEWEISGTEGDYTLTVTGKTDESGEYPAFSPYYFRSEKLNYLRDQGSDKYSVVPLSEIDHAIFKNISYLNASRFLSEDDKNNYELKTLKLPKTLEEFVIFGSLNELQSIELENGSESFDLKNGILYGHTDGDDTENATGYNTIILCPAYKGTESFTVPDNVSIINYNAFCGNKVIKTLKLNEELAEIKEDAFLGSSITELIIPESYKPMESGYGSILREVCFTGMKELRKFSVADGNPYYTDDDGVLFTKDKTGLAVYPAAREGDKNKVYAVPGNVRTLGFIAFESALLKGVYIPKTVEKIIGSDDSDPSIKRIFVNSSIIKIYYEGTEEEWNALWDNEYNDPDNYLPEVVFNHVYDPEEDDPDPEDDPEPIPDPNPGPDPEKKPEKVPVLDPASSYASPADNFAPVYDGDKITKLQLDFSKVKESDVAPGSLKMTVIKGSKLTTVSRIAEGGKVEKSGGVAVKVNTKNRIATITCKSDGWVKLPMEDGVTYTVNFKVEKPKAKKFVLSAGSGQVIKTITDLFGTDIDSGTLTASSKKNASKATVSADNTLVINPDGKDTIKVRYKYLNKKYKLNIPVK